MKRDLTRILFISGISCLVITLGVYLFLRPAFISQLNLTGKDGLATAISGLTAPVIGLLSTVLLYLALSKQTEFNKEQRLKNEMFLSKLRLYYTLKLQDSLTILVDAFERYKLLDQSLPSDIVTFVKSR